MAESNLGHKAMTELYREEVSTLGAVLSRDVLQLETLCAQSGRVQTAALQGQVQLLWASLLRAAHSLKGAARVMRFSRVADVAHQMEEVLVAGQRAGSLPAQQTLDALLRAADFINASGQWGPGQNEAPAARQQAEACLAALQRQVVRLEAGAHPEAEGSSEAAGSAAAPGEPTLRVRAGLINELLQLGAQGRVLSHRLDQLPQSFLRLSEQQMAAERELDACSAQLAAQGMDAALRRQLLAPVREQMARLRQLRNVLYDQLSQCTQEQALLSERWYAQVLSCRTRPFSDIVSGLPRLVRDTGRALGKQIVLHVEGAATLADRDIMENLEMPLVHLLRNACAHGIELPAERTAAGKPAEGTLTLAATHSDGWLQITVRDDGRGIDAAQVREVLRAQGTAVDALGEQSLLEHIFTQGFSTVAVADAVSGRGIGLAAVRERIREMGGQSGVRSEPGRGCVFTLRVPVTRALLRVLCVRAGGEPYALPLGQIESLIRVSAQERSRGQVTLGGQQVPIIRLQTLLQRAEPATTGPVPPTPLFPVADAQPGLGDGESRMLVLRWQGQLYVLDVGTIEDESELIVHELDARLGDLPLFQAAGLNERGEVVLVLNVQALCAQIAACLAEPVTVAKPSSAALPTPAAATPLVRVLLAEDSALARAHIGSILAQAGGFDLVDVADGLSAWHRLQAEPERFDLLLTDLEMPGMDGCELTCNVRAAPLPLAALPVVILSAKNNEEACRCGTQAGADCYLGKALLGSDPAAFVRALRACARSCR